MTHRFSTFPARISVVALAMAALAGCATPATPPAPGATRLVVPSVPRSRAAAPVPARRANAVAEAAVPSVAVHSGPGQGTPIHRFANPQPSGAPLVFLIEEERRDWLRVLVPVRPNGSTGWVRAADVRVTRHDFAIKVELAAHRITVTKGNEVILSEPIGLGADATPTPGGLYYTKELIEPIDGQGRPDPQGPYGPFAYGLSGFSEVLYDFAGGDGQLGIHGTDDPSSLGRDVSHGCIRMSNEGVTRLARTLPLGVPVQVVA